MAVSAVIAVGVVGAAVSADSSRKAMHAQQDAAKQQMELQRETYSDIQNRMKPYTSAGLSALERLNNGIKPGGEFNRPFSLQDFQLSPGYNFQKQQGENAIGAAAAARGMNTSPAVAAELAKYNQGLASMSYQQAFDNYMTQQGRSYDEVANMASMGANAIAGVNNAQSNMTTGVSNSLGSIGNALSAGYMAQGNAWNRALSQGSSTAMDMYMLNQLKGGGGAGSGGGGAVGPGLQVPYNTAVGGNNPYSLTSGGGGFSNGSGLQIPASQFSANLGGY